MKLALALPADVSIALRRLAIGSSLPVEEAAITALRDWLISHGHLEAEIDEETETVGEA